MDPSPSKPRVSRTQARMDLLSAAMQYVAGEYYEQANGPTSTSDAQSEYYEELLLERARQFAEACDGHGA